MLRYDKNRRHSDTPYFQDDNFPLSPEAVVPAYETCWHRTQPSEKIRRKEQRLTLYSILIIGGAKIRTNTQRQHMKLLRCDF